MHQSHFFNIANILYEVIIYVTDQIFCWVTYVTGFYSNRLLQVNASIARGLTYCKILASHWAIRKIWSTKLPLASEGGKSYPASGLIYVKKVMKLFTFIFEHPYYISYVQSTLLMN